MKRYVEDFASDILNSDNENELMTQDAKRKHKQFIESVLDDCKMGLISDAEAVWAISNKVLGY